MDSLYSSRPETQEEIRVNVARVRERIAVAARRSGRSAADVSLVAVSKYAAPDDGVVAGFLNAGVVDLGENRPQKLLAKSDYWTVRQNGSREAIDFVPIRDRAADDRRLRWHMIGTLQRNKIRRVLPVVSLIHSIDSLKLLEAVDRILTEENERQASERASESRLPRDFQERFPATVSVLLEVHISDDATKQGFSPDEILDVLPKTTAFRRVRIRGLMGMAGLTATPDETRRQFAALRTLRDRCRERYPEFADFNELSMGMSGDFETAVEEGATIVRVGSILYPTDR